MENSNISIDDKIDFVNFGKTTKETKKFFENYDYRKDPFWKDQYTHSKKFSNDIKKVTKLMDEIKDVLDTMNTTIWGEDEYGTFSDLVNKFTKKTDKMGGKMSKDFFGN